MSTKAYAVVTTAIITLEITVSRLGDIGGQKAEDLVDGERERCARELARVLSVLDDGDVSVESSSMRTEITIAGDLP